MVTKENNTSCRLYLTRTFSDGGRQRSGSRERRSSSAEEGRRELESVVVMPPPSDRLQDLQQILEVSKALLSPRKLKKGSIQSVNFNSNRLGSWKTMEFLPKNRSSNETENEKGKNDKILQPLSRATSTILKQLPKPKKVRGYSDGTQHEKRSPHLSRSTSVSLKQLPNVRSYSDGTQRQRKKNGINSSSHLTPESSMRPKFQKSQSDRFLDIARDDDPRKDLIPIGPTRKSQKAQSKRCLAVTTTRTSPAASTIKQEHKTTTSKPKFAKAQSDRALLESAASHSNDCSVAQFPSTSPRRAISLTLSARNVHTPRNNNVSFGHAAIPETTEPNNGKAETPARLLNFSVECWESDSDSEEEGGQVSPRVVEQKGSIVKKKSEKKT